MGLRETFTEQLKAAMIVKDAPRVSVIRMVAAKLKDSDIAVRPNPPVADEAIVAMLRGMAKSRRESVDMYMQGNRPELADKERAEIAVIEGFLPRQMDPDAMQEAVNAAVAETGATSIKDMGRVMADLRAKYAATMDMAAAGPIVKAALAS